jgi:hypothetical protein
MFLTALAYHRGRGTKVDEEGFEAWVARAADAGHRQALIAGRLAHLKSRGVIDSAQRGALESAPDGVVHYTPWSALTAMLPCGEDAAPVANHVRLYNVAYCTDAWEGRRLTELDDDDALLLGSFLGATTGVSDGGPETDYAVYLASFNLGAASAPMRAGADGEDAFSIVAPLSAFDQRRASSRPLNPVRRPILPGPSVDPGRTDSTLYRVKYEDDEVRETLSRLRDPLAAIGVVSDKAAEPEGIYELVAILVREVLHLYQYQERSHDREARLLVNLPVSSPLVHMDDSQPGRLFLRSRDLLFTASGTRILVPPNCRDATAVMLNLKHRLTRHGLLGTTTLGRGD